MPDINLNRDPRVDLTKAKAEFDRDGIAVFRNFVSADEAAELLRQGQRFLRDVAPRMPKTDVFYDVKGDPDTIKQIQRMWRYDMYFCRLMASERIASVAEALLGDAVTIENLQWLDKPPRVGSPTPAHQDGYYFMLEPNEAVTLWLALDPVDETNSRMHYVPGSHKRGVLEHRRTQQLGFSQGLADFAEQDKKIEVGISAQPGDMIAHHSLTIHSAAPNKSDRHRRALGFTYFALAAKEDAARKQAYREKLNQEMVAAGKV